MDGADGEKVVNTPNRPKTKINPKKKGPNPKRNPEKAPR